MLFRQYHDINDTTLINLTTKDVHLFGVAWVFWANYSRALFSASIETVKIHIKYSKKFVLARGKIFDPLSRVQTEEKSELPPGDSSYPPIKLGKNTFTGINQL